MADDAQQPEPDQAAAAPADADPDGDADAAGDTDRLTEDVVDIEPVELDPADFEDDEIERMLQRQQRRKKSMLGAAMLGLHDVIYGTVDQNISIVASNDGMPEPDFDVQLTPDPRDSRVILRKRRWRQRD